MKFPSSFLALILLLYLNIRCSSSEQENVQQPEEITVTDADGNTYKTITLGNQVWMAENLKTTSFNDGTPITEFSMETFGIDWGSLAEMQPFYQWPLTEDLNNIIEEELPFDYYGAIYNHWTLESGKLAPEGWRIPTQEDFRELESFLQSQGFTGQEATVLKSSTGWLPFAGNGTNEIGFDALPNGYVNAFGGPTLAEGQCTLATTTVSTLNSTRILVTLTSNGPINFEESAIQIGSGVRLIKE